MYTINMKEKITIIKQHLNFNQLPKDIKESIIDNEASAMVISFDEGAYTKRTASIDAKIHYENCDNEWVLYKSSFHGLCVERQEDINNI